MQCRMMTVWEAGRKEVGALREEGENDKWEWVSLQSDVYVDRLRGGGILERDKR